MNVSFEITALFHSEIKGGNFKINIHLNSVESFLYWLKYSYSFMIVLQQVLKTMCNQQSTIFYAFFNVDFGLMFLRTHFTESSKRNRETNSESSEKCRKGIPITSKSLTRTEQCQEKVGDKRKTCLKGRSFIREITRHFF